MSMYVPLLIARDDLMVAIATANEPFTADDVLELVDKSITPWLTIYHTLLSLAKLGQVERDGPRRNRGVAKYRRTPKFFMLPEDTGQPSAKELAWRHFRRTGQLPEASAAPEPVATLETVGQQSTAS